MDRHHQTNRGRGWTMNQDPLKASIQCLIIMAMVISGVVYVTGWGNEGSTGEAAVVGALIWGAMITGQLAVLAVALWVTLDVIAGLFK